jgi:hypothetical protein
VAPSCPLLSTCSPWLLPERCGTILSLAVHLLPRLKEKGDDLNLAGYGSVMKGGVPQLVLLQLY